MLVPLLTFQKQIVQTIVGSVKKGSMKKVHAHKLHNCQIWALSSNTLDKTLLDIPLFLDSTYL